MTASGAIHVRASTSATVPAHGGASERASGRGFAGLRPQPAAAILMTLASLVWIPQAALLSIAVGAIAGGASAREILLPAAGLLALGVARAMLDRAGSRRAFRLARAELSRIRAAAADALALQSPLDASRPSSGEVASALVEQAEAIVPYLARFEPLRLKALIVPIAIAACVMSLSWVAALILIAAAPLIPLFMALIGWRAKAASERQLARMGDMSAFLLDRLRGMATIRSFKAVDATAARLRSEAEALRRATMAVLRVAFLSSAVLELFAALGVAMVAVYVGFHFLGPLDFGAWGERLSLAQGLFILLVAPAFFEPLRELSAAWHDRASGLAGLGSVEALAGTSRVVGVACSEQSLAAGGALSVGIEGLRFAYPGADHPAIDGVDLAIRAGERVALVAPSGTGKSTLLGLIAGLAPAQAGTIRIGGVPMTAATAASLRSRIAWLGQPAHIFAGTLRSNITLGRHGDTGGAVRTARIDDLLARRGSMPIGEDGAGLSGGEALRLAIARAAFGRTPGLILADEPTAHLDTTTAAEVTERLLALAARSTLLVATHDMDLARRLDRIVTLSRSGEGEAWR